MKNLSFISGFICCIISQSCFAQAGRVSNTMGSSASYSNNAGAYSNNSYNSSSYSNNNSYSNTSSVHTAQAATAATINNNISYTPPASNNNYSNNIPANNVYYSGNTGIGTNNTTAQRNTRRINPAYARIYNYPAIAANSSSAKYGNYAEACKDHWKQNAEKKHHVLMRHLYAAANIVPSYSVFCFPSLFCDDYNYSIETNDYGFYDGYSALNVSLNGQVVYGADTIHGIVTLTSNNVFIEPRPGGTQFFGARFPYADSKLKSVIVYNGDQQLFLIRLGITDTKLSRVIHIGKLSVFDDSYSFSGHVDDPNLKVMYGGKIHALGALVVLDMRMKLLNSANKAYGIALDPRNFYSTQSVIDYIDRHEHNL